MLRRALASGLCERSLHLSSARHQLKHGPDGQIYRIVFDNEPKNNCIDMAMFREWDVAIRAAQAHTNCVMTVMTGSGKFYTAGSDLRAFERIRADAERRAAAAEVMGHVRRMCDAMIEHGKPLVALVNGPCVGIGVTTLSMCDSVIAADNAYFMTPFTKLGYTPEGLSSRLFSMIHGYAMAAEFLVFGRRFSAQEALQAQLVTRVLPAATYRADAEAVLQGWLRDLPPRTMMLNKRLLRKYDVDQLKAVNRWECEVEVEQWTTEECKQATDGYLRRLKQRKTGQV